MSEKLSRMDWAKVTEENTRARQPGKLAAAKRTYLKELSRDEQMTLAEEIVQTRGAELCRAYKNVVDVSFGYKRSRSSKTGKLRIVRIPGVTFVVKTKWREIRDSDETLPAHLFAYWKIGRSRKLCAVPTDVEAASEYAGIEPQAPPRARVAVRRAEDIRIGVFGSTTCAVQRRGDSSIYALSCRHVFSVTKHLHRQPDRKLEVRLRQPDGPILARTVAVRGRLDRVPTVSFDAQLARVVPTMLESMRATLAGLSFSGFARGVGDIPDKFWIIPSRNGPQGGRQARVRAEKLRIVSNRVIPYSRIGPVRHAKLIEAQVRPATIGGDSGSPAVTRLSGGVLLGMHIAGGRGLSYLIPAWELLAPANYGRPNDVWKLINV